MLSSDRETIGENVFGFEPRPFAMHSTKADDLKYWLYGVHKMRRVRTTTIRWNIVLIHFDKV